MKIGKIIILTLLLYGHEIWSLLLREEHRLFLTRGEGVVRGIFGHKMKEQTKNGENYTTSSFMIYILDQILLGCFKLRTMIWRGHAARVEVNKEYRVLVQKLERYLGVDKITVFFDR